MTLARSVPDKVADERTNILQYLDFQRATILLKAEGLSHDQLNQAIPTSTLTLGGLLKHLALNEDAWINDRFAGLPALEPWASAPFDEDDDWEFHSAADDDPDYLRDLYAASCERSRRIVDAAKLDDICVAPAIAGNQWTLRWVLLHLIEETARHAGHADLLREAIDGVVGE